MKPKDMKVDDPRINWDCENAVDQCLATKRQSHDSILNCRFRTGHPGKHKTCYLDGAEWDHPFQAEPPEPLRLPYIIIPKRES